MQVAMTEVGPEVGQLSLYVNALPIPLGHPMHDKSVTNVMDPRSLPTGSRLETCPAHYTAHQVVRCDVGVAAPVVPEQRTVRGSRRQRFAPG